MYYPSFVLWGPWHGGACTGSLADIVAALPGKQARTRKRALYSHAVGLRAVGVVHSTNAAGETALGGGGLERLVWWSNPWAAVASLPHLGAGVVVPEALTFPPRLRRAQHDADAELERLHHLNAFSTVREHASV